MAWVFVAVQVTESRGDNGVGAKEESREDNGVGAEEGERVATQNSHGFHATFCYHCHPHHHHQQLHHHHHHHHNHYQQQQHYRYHHHRRRHCHHDHAGSLESLSPCYGTLRSQVPEGDITCSFPCKFSSHYFSITSLHAALSLRFFRHIIAISLCIASIWWLCILRTELSHSGLERLPLYAVDGEVVSLSLGFKETTSRGEKCPELHGMAIGCENRYKVAWARRRKLVSWKRKEQDNYSLSASEERSSSAHQGKIGRSCGGKWSLYSGGGGGDGDDDGAVTNPPANTNYQSEARCAKDGDLSWKKKMMIDDGDAIENKGNRDDNDGDSALQFPKYCRKNKHASNAHAKVPAAPPSLLDLSIERDYMKQLCTLYKLPPPEWRNKSQVAECKQRLRVISKTVIEELDREKARISKLMQEASEKENSGDRRAPIEFENKEMEALVERFERMRATGNLLRPEEEERGKEQNRGIEDIGSDLSMALRESYEKRRILSQLRQNLQRVLGSQNEEQSVNGSQHNWHEELNRTQGAAATGVKEQAENNATTTIETALRQHRQRMQDEVIEAANDSETTDVQKGDHGMLTNEKESMRHGQESQTYKHTNKSSQVQHLEDLSLIKNEHQSVLSLLDVDFQATFIPNVDDVLNAKVKIRPEKDPQARKELMLIEKVRMCRALMTKLDKQIGVLQGAIRYMVRKKAALTSRMTEYGETATVLDLFRRIELAHIARDSNFSSPKLLDVAMPLAGSTLDVYEDPDPESIWTLLRVGPDTFVNKDHATALTCVSRLIRQTSWQISKVQKELTSTMDNFHTVHLTHARLSVHCQRLMWLLQVQQQRQFPQPPSSSHLNDDPH